MWREALSWLALGTECVHCGRPGRAWCANCDLDLQSAVEPRTVDAAWVVVCADYDGCLPSAIVGYKDHGVVSLRDQLGAVLAAGVAHLLDAGVEPCPLVPVPSSPSAVRRRGFDHILGLAQSAGSLLDLPVQPTLRSRRRADSARLGASARRANLEGSMRVVLPGTGPVILVDDVRTTGATLRESRRVLDTAGHPVVGQVVIASSIWGDPGVRSGASKG